MQFQETAEVLICWNCAVLIANGDCLECVEASTNIDNPVCTHGPDESCAGWEISVGEEDSGYALRTCWSCGQEQLSDQWCHATAFMYTAEHWVRQGRALTEVARLARERPSAYTGDQHPAALLDRAAEYVRLAVNARRYATEYLSGTSR
jgi:hypothetical protein